MHRKKPSLPLHLGSKIRRELGYTLASQGHIGPRWHLHYDSKEEEENSTAAELQRFTNLRCCCVERWWEGTQGTFSHVRHVFSYASFALRFVQVVGAMKSGARSTLASGQRQLRNCRNTKSSIAIKTQSRPATGPTFLYRASRVSRDTRDPLRKHTVGAKNHQEPCPDDGGDTIMLSVQKGGTWQHNYRSGSRRHAKFLSSVEVNAT